MAGSLKWFEYTTDAGDSFAIFMDESNGEAVGNQDYTSGSTVTYTLPRNIKMRCALYRSANSAYSRKIPIGAVGQTINDLPSTITAEVSGSATGVVLSLRSLTGERVIVIPSAEDTGLNDGDAT
jgi:hypothetical protein